MLEYKVTHPHSAARQQTTNRYSMAYLQYGGIIIYKRYDEKFMHYYNWPKIHQTLLQDISMEHPYLQFGRLQSVSAPREKT
jgi:hypothetical protein